MVRLFPKNTYLCVLFLLSLTGLFFITNHLQITLANGEEESTNPRVAIFYGSLNDKQLSEQMIAGGDIQATFFNITEAQKNSSFIFNNQTIDTIWWVNELHLAIDFSFVGDFGSWIQNGKGLFILNRYFDRTPLTELNWLGINNYWPEVFPLTGESLTHQIVLNNETLSTLNLNQLSYEFNGSSSWVKLNDRSVLLAEISHNENIPFLNDFDSGIWMVQKRVIVGSFSLISSEVPDFTSFKFSGVNSISDKSMSDILGDIARLTMEPLPNPMGNFQIPDLNQIVSTGVLVTTAILSFIGLLKFGVISKLREFIVSIFIGSFLFLAHIAYSPQKRRMSEDDLLDNEMRMQIVGFLEEKGEQGAHLREIQRIIGCGISSLLWHLQALDDFNLVTHHKIGKYHIFYLTGTESLQTTEIALALKSDVAKELCRVLLRKIKPLSLSKISSEIDVHHSSIQHHIKRLSDLSVILILKEKKRSSYIVNPNKVESLSKILEVAS
ncbi:MAG: hypothetical protein ACXAC6_06745 [Candidatus Hodarchaeales archaeon]|jgi:predicted transcriptional regulator